MAMPGTVSSSLRWLASESSGSSMPWALSRSAVTAPMAPEMEATTTLGPMRLPR